MNRILVTAVVSCILSGGIGYLLLPVLRALKAGQSIREIGPTWHNYKAGTPMMGGLMFVAAATASPRRAMLGWSCRENDPNPNRRGRTARSPS